MQNPLIAASTATTYDCGLRVNGDWRASTDCNWISLITASGSIDDPLKVRLSTNNDANDRDGNVSVTVGELTKQLAVHQHGSLTSGFVSATSLNFTTFVDTKTITVTSESDWSITATEGDWFEAEKSNSSTLTVSSSINFSGNDRSGSVTVAAANSEQQATIALSQSFSNDTFYASTPYGREFVYKNGGYIKSVSKDSYRELADGVVSFEMTCTYTDAFAGEQAPLQRTIFLFEVQLSDKITLAATLPNDLDANINTTQRMSQQIPNLQNSRPDIKVLGGINGDFFHADDATYLQGILYRRGVCLKGDFETTVNTVLAIMKDGTAACLTQSEYDQVKANIAEAVGGRQQLLLNGGKSQFSDTRLEPRTAAGVSRDGKTVYLLVIDGRQTLYGTGSYGASYDALARIMQNIGAYEAINLDGGGSSTYIVRDASGSGFSMRNKPGNSGNVERAVLDGWAVIQK